MQMLVVGGFRGLVVFVEEDVGAALRGAVGPFLSEVVCRLSALSSC